MSSALAQCLVRDGVLGAETVRTALGRQLVYGGALDTVLLEMGVVDEAAVWGALAAATGWAVPAPELVESVSANLAALAPADGLPGLAVPLGRADDRLQVLCADVTDQDALRAAADGMGLGLELFVAPEVRVRVAARTVFGAPVPPRFLRLLARLVGSQPVRRWIGAQESAAAPSPRGPISVVVTVQQTVEPAPAAKKGRATARGIAAHAEVPPPRATRFRRTLPMGAAPVTDDPGATVEGMAPLQQVLELTRSLGTPEDVGADGDGDDGRNDDDGAATATGPAPASVQPPPPPPPRGTLDDQALRAAESDSGDARAAALRSLRGHLGHPRVQALSARLRDDVTNAPGERAIPSVTALGELRDPAAVPALIARLRDKDAGLNRAVHEALVEITKEDLGTGARRWRTWWEKHGDEDRVDWLFAGLSHKSPEIRYSASDELRLLTGEYFGYHFDLPKREREEARRRWESWWLEHGRGRKASAQPMPVVPPDES